MLAHMKMHHTDAHTEIMLTVPTEDASKVIEAIQNLLKFGGHTIRHVNAEGEEMFSVEEVFPDANPGMILRGFRGRDDITQEELAKRLGVSVDTVIALENNKLSMSLEMAKMIGAEFNLSYKAFL